MALLRLGVLWGLGVLWEVGEEDVAQGGQAQVGMAEEGPELHAASRTTTVSTLWTQKRGRRTSSGTLPWCVLLDRS